MCWGVEVDAVLKCVEIFFIKILCLYHGLLKYCCDFLPSHLFFDNDGFVIEQLKSLVEYISP